MEKERKGGKICNETNEDMFAWNFEIKMTQYQHDDTTISTITAIQSMQLRVFKPACQWNIERFRHLASIPRSSESQTFRLDRNWMNFALSIDFLIFLHELHCYRCLSLYNKQCKRYFNIIAFIAVNSNEL